MVPRRRGFALVLLLALAAPIAAAAPPVRPKEMEARKAFAAGEWKQALQLFAELYAETLHPVYLRNIGRCHQKLRDPERAIDAFREYLVKGRQVTAQDRAEVEGYIKEMQLLQEERARETAERPAVSPAAPAPDLSPRPPAAPIVTAAPEPPSRPPVYTRWWFWTGIGVAIAGGVAAAVLLNRSPGDVCPPGVNCQGMP